MMMREGDTGNERERERKRRKERTSSIREVERERERERCQGCTMRSSTSSQVALLFSLSVSSRSSGVRNFRMED